MEALDACACRACHCGSAGEAVVVFDTEPAHSRDCREQQMIEQEKEQMNVLTAPKSS